jgi:hypothetical protein
MLEYLYNLLQDVDRCDITNNELRQHIDKNGVVINRLKTHRSQIGGGNGDEEDIETAADPEPESAEGTTSTGSTEVISIEGTQEFFDRIKATIAESTKDIAQTETFLKEFNSPEKVSDRTETISIAKLLSKFLADLSVMIRDKGGELGTLQQQVDEITGLLSGYTTVPEGIVETLEEAAEGNVEEE